MRKILSALALSAAVAATPALAADLVPAAVEPAIPVVTAYNWSGPYIGAQAGYSYGQLSSYSTNLIGQFPINFDHDVNSFRGAVHAGYNFQSNAFVYGVEGDVGFAVGDGNVSNAIFGGVYTAQTKTVIDGSLRLRAGYAFDNLLIYATGGLAVGDVDTHFRCPVGCTPLATAHYDIDDTRIGWTVGAGVEYMFDESWSARLEYRYTDFGSKSKFFPSPVVAISNGNEYKESRVMLGVSYHFH